MRYREIGGEFPLDPWSMPLLDCGERAGLKLPTRGQAVWNLESGGRKKPLLTSCSLTNQENVLKLPT
jgi:hypothetical protein